VLVAALAPIDEMIGRHEIIRAIIVPPGEGILKIGREFATLTMVTLVDEHGCKIQFG
jgi:hypothetical protein